MYRKLTWLILAIVLLMPQSVHANNGLRSRVTAVIDHYGADIVNRDGCNEVQFQLNRYADVITRHDTFGGQLNPCTTQVRTLMYNHTKYVRVISGNNTLILVAYNNPMTGYHNKFLLFNNEVIFNRGGKDSNPVPNWVIVTHYLYNEIPDA